MDENSRVGKYSWYPVALASAWRKTTLTYLRAPKYSTRTRWTGTTAFPLSFSLFLFDSALLQLYSLSSLFLLSLFSFLSLALPSLLSLCSVRFISLLEACYAELKRISMQPNRYGNYYHGALSERLHPIYDTDRYVRLQYVHTRQRGRRTQPSRGQLFWLCVIRALRRERYQ